MLNSCVFIGRLTADPTMLEVGDGVSLCKFAIAVERGYMKDEEKVVDFIEIAVWRKRAEHCYKYLKKGSMVAIQGKYQIRDYEDSDGLPQKRHEIIADDVRFLANTILQNNDEG